MPIKLIGTVILVVIVGIFCGFNTSDANKCDINLIFYKIRGIPVFLTVLLSFLAGVLVMSPFTVRFGKNQKTSDQTNDEPKAEATSSNEEVSTEQTNEIEIKEKE